jgi:hypothetical protein
MKKCSTFGMSACALSALVVSGCLKQPASAPATPSQLAKSACEHHVLDAEDFAGILSAPITAVRPLPGDAQSCEFATSAFPGVVVSVRPGLGRSTVHAWESGKMPLRGLPLPGVGEAAIWQDTLHEVVAERNDVLCDIQVRGGGSDLAMNDKALPAAVGALCNKIFSAI